MMTMEKRAEFQSDYKKYDIEVRPKNRRQQQKKSGVTAKDRSRILLLLALVGVICIGMILASAYGASVNYKNNQLRDSNAALKGEVETLEIKIDSLNNIASIEDRAMKDLGMIYAEGNQFKVISSGEEKIDNLASRLKEKAFN